jgi:8-oxo-dGTP diphosphatase
MTDAIKVIDLTQTDPADFDAHLADCVVLTREGRILMQRRPANWGRFAGCLNIFGGHVEKGESVIAALVRELNEELGAEVNPADVVFIGALTEEFTGHREVVHVHFWHDKDGTITGCYEAEAAEYETTAAAMAHPKIMDYARWALEECTRRRLIPISRS